jgi:two-component system CheB/CheR fusion protein
MASHGRKRSTQASGHKEGGSRGDIEAVLERIREASNFDFRNYKRATLRRRIERRMVDRRKLDVEEYLALLDAEPAEYDALLRSMLIKVTSFFRDPEVWDVLSKKTIPQLLAEKRPGEEIRIWCAGCATGEEAFSIAILMAEAMGPAFSNQDIKIFGTDVDEKAIASARRGVYRKEQLERVPKQMLRDWFVEEAGGYSVRKEIRRCVVFGINNLVSDAPISRLDLLLCRNVFIYLDNQLQKRVLTRFHYALRRNGILVLGKSELIPFAAKIYEPLDLARRVYRKDGRGNTTVQQERLVGLLEQESVARGGDEAAELGVTELFHRDVVQSLRTPVLVTGLDGTIMLWNAASAALWGRARARRSASAWPRSTCRGCRASCSSRRPRRCATGAPSASAPRAWWRGPTTARRCR